MSRWIFTLNGDGPYRISNAATRQLLGVDSKANAGRAWAAKPTATKAPRSGPSVGQQWFVIPNFTADGRPTGTHRLVNRYSGLVLGLSDASGRLARDHSHPRVDRHHRQPGRRRPDLRGTDPHPVRGGLLTPQPRTKPRSAEEDVTFKGHI
ncbi:RICIN domain-containing protein [Streptomyces sp. NPDC099050]|uniref:RICIN domain-containing protein n=1 Tax=Streptomyces sp. NPDC099050 TaxID=3366100 RepID=UPI00381C6D7E